MTLSLSINECYYLGICLAGYLFGLYSGIFALYLQYHASKTETVKSTSIIFYALCFLYILSVATIGFDIVSYVTTTPNITVQYAIQTVQYTLFACCDTIAQSILIYRCWIVWGQNIRVVIVPSILTLAFFAIFIASITPESIAQLDATVPDWSFILTLTSLAASISVNALVTGLIVLKIFKVYRVVKPLLDEPTLGVTGGRKLYSIISVIIESGMILFSVQLARFVVTVVQTNAADSAFQIIVCIHEILNGIIPTIVLVQVSARLSFHDKTLSMMSETSEILHFGPDRPDHSTPETGDISQETRNDYTGISFSDDIQIVEES